MEELILAKAKKLFCSLGLRTTTMDDIAKSAGVSKKTIYQRFSGKDEILDCVVKDYLNCHQQGLEQANREAKNAVEQVLKSSQTAMESIAMMHQNFHHDLERSFPQMWLLIQNYRTNVLLPDIIQNLHNGIEEGNYRADLNIPFVADFRVQQMLTALNPQTFNDRTCQGNTLMLQLSEFYLHGITTIKGKKLINKYLNVNNEKQISKQN